LAVQGKLLREKREGGIVGITPAGEAGTPKNDSWGHSKNRPPLTREDRGGEGEKGILPEGKRIQCVKVLPPKGRMIRGPVKTGEKTTSCE